MIEFNVSQEMCNKVRHFETEMLNKYANAIYPYLPLFNKIGYELKVELGWYNSLQKTWSAKGLPLKNGYECRIYCLVEKDGKEVQIESNDGEADYYPLITSWMISSVYRKFHKLKISTYAKVDDVEADINEFLSELKHLG